MYINCLNFLQLLQGVSPERAARNLKKGDRADGFWCPEHLRIRKNLTGRHTRKGVRETACTVVVKLANVRRE
jgi:hypothetical protein